jgi:tetratricopeptide (TPR) repeat protein
MYRHTEPRKIIFLLFCAFFFLQLPLPAQAQGRNPTDPSLPVELTPADQEIRELLRVGDDSCKLADPDAWTERIQKALQIAESRELVGDRAIVEALLASALITQGNTDQAFIVFRKALQDSIDAKREVVEADIPISLASERQMKGNSQEAIDLVTQAVSLSERTGSLSMGTRAVPLSGQSWTAPGLSSLPLFL